MTEDKVPGNIEEKKEDYLTVLNKKITESKNIIFKFQGGLGKQKAASDVVSAAKKKYPKKNIVVHTGNPDWFLHNPEVYELYHPSNPLYLHKRFVDESDSIMYAGEPYEDPLYINTDASLAEVWCNMFGLNPEDANGKIYFSNREKKLAKRRLKTMGIKPEKCILFQWQGGIVPQVANPVQQEQAKAPMHVRAIDDVLAKKIVEKLVEKGYKVLQLQHPNQESCSDDAKVPIAMIQNGQPVPLKIREAMAFITQCKTFIGIDSFLQHLGAAYDVPGLVLWGGTNPNKLGYKLHENMSQEVCPTPHCGRPDWFLSDIQANGEPWECPHGEACMEHDIDLIMEKFDKVVERIDKTKSDADKKEKEEEEAKEKAEKEAKEKAKADAEAVRKAEIEAKMKAEIEAKIRAENQNGKQE